MPLVVPPVKVTVAVAVAPVAKVAVEVGATVHPVAVAVGQFVCQVKAVAAPVFWMVNDWV